MNRTYIRRGTPETKPCAQCGTIIARPYKMTIEHWEKRKYCSQKCHGIARKGINYGGHKQWTEERHEMMSKMLTGNQFAKGHKPSLESILRGTQKRMGPKHWDWRDDSASYSAFHKWLVNNYGPATMCENKNCPEKGSRFEYALIAGKNHSHKRENYIMLCSQCHRAYDHNLGNHTIRIVL